MSKLCLPDLNEVTLACRLTRDPELKYLPSGTQVCEFGVAQSRKWKDQHGETHEETYFGEVKCWTKTAEYVAKHFHKGSAVLVRGRLALETWIDKDTGGNRSKTRIVASRVDRLEWDDDGGGGRSEQQRRETQSAEPLPEPEDEDDILF